MPGWLPLLQSQFGEIACTDAAALDALAVSGVRPACACAPKDAEQAAAVIRFAAANRIPVLPRGNGTAQGIGFPPLPDALAVSTRKMDALVHHEPGDMVATAQAGMELGAFQKSLAERGQWLPLDGPERATIGGLIATNRSRPLAHGCGTLRDMVLGMSVVNGDGVLRKCGGKVVKNVTGYALDKLYIGSLGTLGLVTEVTFKLRPLPIKRQHWAHVAGDLSGGLAILRNIAAKNLPLECLFAEAEEAGFRVRASAAGTDLELERIVRELNAVIAPDSRPPREMSNCWECSVDEGRFSAEPGAVLRFWCPGSALGAVLDLLASIPRRSLNFGATGGHARLALDGPAAKKLAAGFSALGVNFRFERVSGIIIDEPFGPPRPEWELMKRIKAALDPRGIMNPGRFVV